MKKISSVLLRRVSGGLVQISVTKKVLAGCPGSSSVAGGPQFALGGGGGDTVGSLPVTVFGGGGDSVGTLPATKL